MTVDAHALLEWDAEVAEIAKDALSALISASEERAIAYLEEWDNIQPPRENGYGRSELGEALNVLRAERKNLAEIDLDPLLHGQIYDRMLRLIFAVITVTDACALISAPYEHQSNQAAYARERRSERPEKIILQAAIKQSHGDRASARPYKDAAVIFDQVNACLQSLGYKPVTVDAIALRLKKYPNS